MVQADAASERDGFTLVDTLVAGREAAILDALAAIDGCAPEDVKLHEVLPPPVLRAWEEA